MAEVTHTGTESDTVDLLEHGRGEDGQRITSNRRLFMQLLVYGGCVDTTALVDALGRHGVSGALYEDVNDPHGVARADIQRGPGVLRRRRAAVSSSIAVRGTRAEAGVHDVRAHLRAGLRGRPRSTR